MHAHIQISNEVNDLREWPLVKVRGCFKKRAILKRVIARLRNSPNWKKTKRDVTASFRGSRNSPSFLLPSRLLFRKNLSSKAISSSSSPCSFRNRRIVRWPFARDTFRPPYKLTHPISPLNSFNSEIQQSFDELSVYRDSPVHTSILSRERNNATLFFTRRRWKRRHRSPPWLPPRWNEMRAVAYNRKRQKQ